MDSRTVRICSAGDHLSTGGAFVCMCAAGRERACTHAVSQARRREFRQQGGRAMQKLTLENVEADPAELVNVGVVHSRQEAHLWRRHWVLLGKEQLKLEAAAYSTAIMRVN